LSYYENKKKSIETYQASMDVIISGHGGKLFSGHGGRELAVATMVLIIRSISVFMIVYIF
jgi:hypothetical protein